MKHSPLSVGDVFLRPTKMAFKPCQVVSFTEDKATLREMFLSLHHGWRVDETIPSEDVSRFDLKQWQPFKLK